MGGGGGFRDGLSLTCPKDDRVLHVAQLIAKSIEARAALG